MDKTMMIRIIGSLMIFLLTFIVLDLAFVKPPKSKIKSRRNPFSSLSPKAAFYIVLAAGGISYVVSQYAYSTVTTLMVFLGLIGMAPLLLNNERRRMEQEALFGDVILYSQNMGMLLRQTHNVYSSIQKASQDLSTSLKEDLNGLLAALDESKETTLATMETLEKNYPYSCIKNLDAILLHMFYENANVDDSLLMTYQDDVTTLEQDVRKNKMKRRSLRISYIIITIGSLLSYCFFLGTLADTFSGSFDNDLFRFLNTGYLFATMLSFFGVDRYFNLNTTKE